MNEVVKINVAMDINTVNEYRAIIGGQCYTHQAVIDSIDNLLQYANSFDTDPTLIPVKKLKKLKKAEKKELSYWESLSEIFDKAAMSSWKESHKNHAVDYGDLTNEELEGLLED